MSDASVAVVIPAWNEPDSIVAVLGELPAGVADRVFVVVGDDRDPTAAVAQRNGAVPLVPSRSGYGAACTEGARAAIACGADVLVFLDGDYSDPPGEVPRLLQSVVDGSADLALGVRDLSRHPTALPAHARFGNRLVLLALTGLLGRSFRDLPSFKVIRADAFTALDLRERTYGWTVEMLVKATRANLRIAEEPVPYRPRLAGRSKVSGTVRGTIGAAWKLMSSALRYASWEPHGSMGIAPAGRGR